MEKFLKVAFMQVDGLLYVEGVQSVIKKRFTSQCFCCKNVEFI